MMSSSDIARAVDTAKDLDRIRKELEEVLNDINKLHKKLQTTPEVVERPGDNSISKLKSFYDRAKELSEDEVNASHVLIGQLDVLMASGPTGQQRRRIEGNEQKKKRLKADSNFPRLSPVMRSHSLKGEQVAAKVTPENSDKDEWFVVKVMNFDREAKEIEVLDEEPGDDEEGGGQRKYTLPMERIIPFPKPNDPSAKVFTPGSHVLAVYPGTTALYKATVFSAPCKRTDEYVLEFDDDEEDGYLPKRNVPFHRVVDLPDGHRQ